MANEQLAEWLQANAHFSALTLAMACGSAERTIQRKLQLLNISTKAVRRARGLSARWIPEEGETPTPYIVGSASSAGDSIDLKKSSSGLSANLLVQTKQGETLSLPEAMENPKFLKALESSDINLDDFEVIRFKSNSWDVTLKLPDGPETRTNHQFSVEWKRKAPTPLATAMERLLERVEPAPPRKAVPMYGDRMVEVSLYDLHFGLLAWKAEVGEDYDVGIASAIFGDAVAQLAVRTLDLEPAYYLVPIGNDLFHVNDTTNTTPQAGNRLDVDTRLGHIIEVVERALESMVETLAEIAPVKLIWIPGNHDPQTSYWLMRVLAARYRDDDRVEVDTSPMPRKYHVYGKNLIGFMHGCDMPPSRDKSLAGLMADEAAHLWAPNQYREIHRGHTHKKAELCFIGAETYGSVVVRTIPSLGGTDYWHFTKGFVETSKTAQYFVWNKDYGLESVCDIHVPASLYHKGTPV